MCNPSLKIEMFSSLCPGDSDINHRATPIITTFSDKYLSQYDIKDFIEQGLRIVRFRITKTTPDDKIRIHTILEEAKQQCCEKHEVKDWPIALSLDIPNICINTGFLSDTCDSKVFLKENSIIEMTSDVKYITKCNAERIFMNDPYTLPTVTPGTEIFLGFGKIMMICTENIDQKTIKCKILQGGLMENQEIVSLRGIKLLKPPLTKRDLDLIQFAKDYKYDMVTVNSLRFPETLHRIRELFKGFDMPLLLSTICEQQGIDNIDAIIAASDGVILAREFLSCSIPNWHQLFRIQGLISAKCRMQGKPFYISGNILERSLLQGSVVSTDLNDISYAMQQGAGFVLRNYDDPRKVTNALCLLNEICTSCRPPKLSTEFWEVSKKHREVPVNAADACIQSCILIATMVRAKVVIVPTVTGRTAKELSLFTTDFFILAITTDPVVARQLLLYSRVISIIYDKTTTPKTISGLDHRVAFAVEYGLKFDLLKYEQTYVVLKRSKQGSCYCDQISVWRVITPEERIRMVERLCKETYELFEQSKLTLDESCTTQRKYK